MTNGAKLLHFNKQPLIVWLRGEEQLPHLESQLLAKLMGYVQVGSIRKQIDSNWEDDFLHLVDFELIRDEEELRAYETFALLHLGHCKPAKLERGRVFLSPDGIQKVLEHSKKTSKEFKEFLRKEGVLSISAYPAQGFTDQVEIDFEEEEVPASSTIRELEQEDVQEERQRKYEVVQSLLHNLSAHQDLVLRELAIEAAELVLGIRLERVREKVLGQKCQSSPPPRKTDGPLFEEEGWYSLRQIGKLAGGYSASSAGKAANIVATRWGHSPSDIRNRQLHFNTFVTREINGSPRTWAEFNRAFSNEVVCEARSNETVAPKKSPSAEAVLERSGNYANLSEDLDFFQKKKNDEELSENMESFLETLEGERPKH